MGNAVCLDDAINLFSLFLALTDPLATCVPEFQQIDGLNDNCLCNVSAGFCQPTRSQLPSSLCLWERFQRSLFALHPPTPSRQTSVISAMTQLINCSVCLIRPSPTRPHACRSATTHTKPPNRVPASPFFEVSVFGGCRAWQSTHAPLNRQLCEMVPDAARCRARVESVAMLGAVDRGARAVARDSSIVHRQKKFEALAFVFHWRWVGLENAPGLMDSLGYTVARAFSERRGGEGAGSLSLAVRQSCTCHVDHDARRRGVALVYRGRAAHAQQTRERTGVREDDASETDAKKREQTHLTERRRNQQERVFAAVVQLRTLLTLSAAATELLDALFFDRACWSVRWQGHQRARRRPTFCAGFATLV